jgi:hypothetical protein
MADIFISYRRSDAEGWAGRLSDSLKANLRRVRVFCDVDNIPPGVEFDTYITKPVGSCEVLIALISPRWLSVSDSGRRRLDDPKDFIRIEIATALGRKVRVIPVVVGKAGMPSPNDLPDEIKPLARLQAYELTDSRWADDCRALAKELKQLIDRRRWRDAAKAIAAIALVSVGVGGALRMTNWNGASPYPPPLPGLVSTFPKPPISVRSLSGNWVDSQGVMWRIRHSSDGRQIVVHLWNGQSWEPPLVGNGGFDGERWRFALSGNSAGELDILDYQQRLIAYIRHRDGGLYRHTLGWQSRLRQ